MTIPAIARSTSIPTNARWSPTNARWSTSTIPPLSTLTSALPSYVPISDNCRSLLHKIKRKRFCYVDSVPDHTQTAVHVVLLGRQWLLVRG